MENVKSEIKRIKGTGRRSLAHQIFVFFVVALFLTDILSFFVIRRMAYSNVISEKKKLAEGVALDIDKSVKEYEAYDWVISYLLQHEESELDLEYDKNDETIIKTKELTEKHPGMMLDTITADEIEELSAEEQKAFAEIIFNNWLLRFNDLKEAYNAEYIYFLVTDDNYEEDTFVVNSNGGNLVRGTKQGEAYIFGVKVTNNDIQRETFMKLTPEEDDVVITNGYMDSYHYMDRIGDMNVIIGMTFETGEVQKNIQNQTLRFLMAFILLQIVLVIICRLMLSKTVLNPIRQTEAGVKTYAGNKDAAEAKRILEKIHSQNEIGGLADGVYEMICEIENHLEEIKKYTAENERISVELNLAQKIQTDMLPSVFPPFPENKEFDIYASSDPAKEVGGDFYDFFKVDENHVALVIADVSGKGVPASLFMVVAKTLIKNHTKMGISPSEVLTKVNNQLLEGNSEGMFVTVWMAVIDIRTGKGVVANAGHEHPVLRHKNGEYELVKYRHSMAVAMMPDAQIKEHEIELQFGDRIFVYTDGLPESRSDAGEFFGMDRMIESLNKTLKTPETSGKELLESVTNDMNDFVHGAEQFDDVTMLVFDYFGQQ